MRIRKAWPGDNAKKSRKYAHSIADVFVCMPKGGRKWRLVSMKTVAPVVAVRQTMLKAFGERNRKKVVEDKYEIITGQKFSSLSGEGFVPMPSEHSKLHIEFLTLDAFIQQGGTWEDINAHDLRSLTKNNLNFMPVPG